MNLKKKSYGTADMLGIPLRCAQVPAALTLLHYLLAGIVPTLQIMATAQFINMAVAIVQGHALLWEIYPSLFAVVGLIAFNWISADLVKFAQVRSELAIRKTFRTALIDQRASLVYRHIENPDTWDLVARVTRNPEKEVQDAFNVVLNIGSKFVQIAGIFILLFTKVWWAPLAILAFSVPLFILSIKSGKASYQANREVTRFKRRYEYLSSILTGRDAAAERTLFGFSQPMNRIWHRQFEKARKIELRAQRKWFIKMKSGSILTTLVAVLIIFVLVKPVLSGAMTLGLFISLVNAVFGLVQMMSWELTGNIDQLASHREYMRDLSQFVSLETVAGAQALPAQPTPVFETLAFENVRFRYPGTESYILNGTSFRIESGKHYAFVGINGAGKTTITKLLTGLYDEFEGTITINGKSITHYSLAELKAFFSVVYQDFARFEMPVRDNVAVGDVNGQPRILEAVERTGLAGAVGRMPAGLDTPLGKIKEGGVDLSGGEWQRLAMARALVNPAPIRILDEPTAALDPLSESRLYQEYEQMSMDKTTLFISHRLGSTKLADDIFVLRDGRVVEQGSHEDLMQSGGEYAEMFDSQRSWYQE